MFDFIAITRALSDKNRVRILAALEDRELCVCQIIEMLGLSPSTVSQHLSILRHARLITGRKQGRWMYYRHADNPRSDAIDGAIRWALDCVHDTDVVRQDRMRLEEIVADMACNA